MSNTVELEHTIFDPEITSLPLLAKGKVRNNYAVGDDHILMVATDRLSAFDVVMNQPIPQKGVLLNQMSLFWFEKLQHITPNHLTDITPESVVTPQEVSQVSKRAVVVKRLTPILVEAVVRGYMAGSGWKEYQQTQSICEVGLPKGLKNSDPLPEPIFTPAAKADAGEHDENISFAEMSNRIGVELATQIKKVSLQLYKEAAQYARSKGIIIADTKFEFGLDNNNQLILMDEILTPDSSRYWPIHEYQKYNEKGLPPPSYDKQPIRDWLEKPFSNGTQWNKRPPAPDLTLDIIEQTKKRYTEAYRLLCLS